VKKTAAALLTAAAIATAPAAAQARVKVLNVGTLCNYNHWGARAKQVCTLTKGTEVVDGSTAWAAGWSTAVGLSVPKGVKRVRMGLTLGTVGAVEGYMTVQKMTSSGGWGKEVGPGVYDYNYAGGPFEGSERIDLGPGNYGISVALLASSYNRYATVPFALAIASVPAGDVHPYHFPYG
jgi:hypothetical protein